MQTYEMCERLHQLVWRLPRHRFPVTQSKIYSEGLYFLFETDECGHGGDRIVRVGCHTGADNLASRLIQHTSPYKESSIFRKSIGGALLSKAGDSFLRSWDSKKPSLDKAKQTSVEKQVTDYIVGHISVAVIPVSETRLDFEKLCIATVAQCPHCHPSESWLGHFSPKSKIRTSGLWQQNHVSGVVLQMKDIKELERLATI